ncbi:MAG TPA: DUF1989 domain-containing protein [Frankiaceae bacterium]
MTAGLPTADTVLVDHTVPGGAAWTVRLRAGRVLRLALAGDGGNAAVLLFPDADRHDRLNVPDTLKAQLSFCVRPSMVLMSTLGRGLATVIGSSLDWHDAVTGHSLPAHLARFGPSSYATDRNDQRLSARDGLVSELRKQGLGERDLHACVNFFSKVVPADDDRGTLSFVPGHGRAGDWVELRAALDLLVVLATAPHPMDAASWQPAGVRVTVLDRPDSPDRSASAVPVRDESRRALATAEAVLA